MRIDRATEERILHSLKNYHVNMGMDITEFAHKLGVTRQRVRVVSRKYGVDLPFPKAAMTLRYEKVLMKTEELVKRQIEGSRRGEDVREYENEAFDLDLDDGKDKKEKELKSVEKQIINLIKTELLEQEKRYIMDNKDKTPTSISEEIGVTEDVVEQFMNENKDSEQPKQADTTNPTSADSTSSIKAEDTEDIAQEETPTPRRRKPKSRTELPQDKQQYLIDNADRSWTHLARETNLSIYLVKRFLQEKGFVRPGKRGVKEVQNS